MLFKCKICGGNLNVTSGERVTECEYCGVKQTIPRFTEPETQEVYNRANSYLKNNEFDKAENLYNQILFKNKKDADAYWNVLMCRYGVTYVKDPASGKYIPTCNRTLYNSIFNDENYLNAIEYADEQQKALYEENAQTIDNIQKGILSVSKKEKPFDIFISYKETDVNGARTNDSIAAQELYNKLTAEGYKVFFSRITLEDKIGTEYEPYIYAALASSKVMITVSSSKENIKAVWVKNEWSRFLSFMAKDSSKSIIPLYYDMPKTDLPDEFAHLTAYDMHENGFEQELIRGIKKLIPTPVVLKERRKKRNKILKRGGIAAIACLIVGVICAVPWLLKLPDYNAAMQLYYDKNYPEAAWAFGSLGDYRDCAEMKKKCELSWRKSLANVVCWDYGEMDSGGYAINPNGTIENKKGVNLNGFELNEHGKIISISTNYQLYALREDGYVDNAEQNDGINKGAWKDIIQISDVIGGMTNVALNSQGKMYCGNVDCEWENVDWTAELKKWNNIVSFKVESWEQEYGAIIMGLTRLGKLRAITCGLIAEENMTTKIQNILNKFEHVIKYDFYYGYDEFNIVAITSDNTLISYINGKFDTKPIDNVVDVRLYGDKILCLKSNGTVVELESNKTLIEDVVHIDYYSYVTRTGNVYSLEFDNGKWIKNKESAIVSVYDEWIERLN